MRRPKSIKQLLNKGKRMQRLYPNGWPGNMRAVLYLNAKKALESIAEVVARLLFNGIDQYFTHTAWQPSGVNFDLGLTYTPAAGDIGTEKTLIAGLLTKNASNQLVVTYTDINSVVNTLTLSALTLTADTEYNIAIISDGNGIELSAGGQSVSDADVIDPLVLSVSTWLADAGGTGGHANGVASDLSITDQNLLQNGQFVNFDGASMYIDVPTITLDNFVCVAYCARETLGDRNRFFGGSATGFSWLGSALRFTDSSGVNHEATGLDGVSGQYYKVEIRCGGTTVDFYLDGNFVGTDTYDGLPVEINLLAATSSTLTNNGPMILEFTNSDTGDNYQYLTDGSVTDNGDGTAALANTGNTGASFDATLQGFSPGGLVLISGNSHAWPLNQAQATQDDTVGTNNGTIVNYNSGMLQ